MFYKTYGLDQKDFIDAVKNPETKLDDILKDSRLNYAVRFEVPEVITFLFDRLNELMDISISESENSMTARGVLFDLCDQFSLNISESTVFHNKMNSILGHDPISKTAIIVFSRMILSLGKTENYNIISNLSENQFFFPKFCQFIDHNSVYETLISLASNDHQSISAFFEDLNASSILFNLLEKSPPSSQEKYFYIISEIISHTDTESTLIASLADNEHSTKIFDYATKSDNSKVRLGAFTLLKTLCSKKQQTHDSYSSNDVEDEDTIFSNATMEFIMNHFDDLCKYISKLTTFDASTQRAVELLIILIKSKKGNELRPSVFESINGLLDQFFLNPIETKLHSSCLTFLCTICTTPAAVRQTDLKNRILKAWMTTKHDHRSSFWGFIFKFTEIVLDLGDGSSDDDDDQQKKSEAREKHEENEENQEKSQDKNEEKQDKNDDNDDKAQESHEKSNEKVDDDETDWDRFIQDYSLYMQVVNNSYGGELPVDSFENFDEIEGEMHIDDEMVKNDDFIDDEIRVIADDDEEEDDENKEEFNDDLNQFELDLKNDEDLDHFVIKKPKKDPSSPWAKDILDDLNDDFFIPKKEKTAKDVDWANQILKELQDDNMSDNFLDHEEDENNSKENDNDNNNNDDDNKKDNDNNNDNGNDGDDNDSVNN